MQLDSLLDEPVPLGTKGWPHEAAGLPLRAAGERGWRLLAGELPLPVAVMRESALAHNSRWMRGFLALSGALLCPHGKTTMAPQLFRRQLRDGAWGITIATPQQLEVCRRFGVQRVLMANQLVDPQGMAYVLDELARDRGFRFLSLVDSFALARRLESAAAARDPGRPLEVLLELGHEDGRTGCRTMEQAMAVARAVHASPHLVLRGVEGYEGSIKGGSAEARAAAVEAFLSRLAELTVAIGREGLFAPGEVLLSAGGSTFFDLVAKGLAGVRAPGEVRLLIRSGCYLTHDSKTYVERFEELRKRTPEADRLGPGLRGAIEVWALVQSLPEPGLAILGAGRRDLSYDQDLPVPEAWLRPVLHERPQPLGGCHIGALDDQHAYLHMPEDTPLAVGDMVALGISHPCTTFDKWQLLHVVDDDYRVIEAIRTFF
jgi:D-serine dehydratase